MRGFFRYIPPFAPDYSGAVSALFKAGGMVVLCDPGGCSGNVAGYDEPRFYGSGAAFYSAAIRELDTIFGRDDKLERKILAAAELGDYAFIALVGSPVVSVIGTDLDAVARKVEKQCGIPTFAVSATGMEDYSRGERLALTAFVKKFLPETSGSGRGDRIGIFGATPLNAAGGDDLAALMGEIYGERAVLFSEAGGAAALGEPGQFERLLCLSPGGLQACEVIHRKLGIPYEMRYPRSPVLEKAAAAVPAGGRVLILHQQAVGNALREELRQRTDAPASVSVGTFFLREPGLAEAGDLVFQGEDELMEAARSFDVIAADPLYRRALAGTGAVWVDLPHTACSGDLYY